MSAASYRRTVQAVEETEPVILQRTLNASADSHVVLCAQEAAGSEHTLDTDWMTYMQTTFISLPDGFMKCNERV